MTEETYYKAVRPDGTDFYSGRVAWDRMGEIVRHPNPGSPDEHDAKGYLSVSVSPTDCTGMKWPCRLFVVEPVDGVPVWEPTSGMPSKRASHAWRVVRELPAYEALGPNGVEIVAFLDLLPTLTSTQWINTFAATRAATRDAAGDAAWGATRDATWGAARAAAWDAAWSATRDATRSATRNTAEGATRAAAWDAAWNAAGYAVIALLVRDLITKDHFDILTAPMRAAGIDFDTLTEADRD